MSELKINTLKPVSNTGTTIIGDSGDTITIPAGATIANSGTEINFGAKDLVKVSSVTYTGRVSQTSAPNAAWFALTGLNLDHQATSTSNRLLFIGQVCGALNPSGSSWVTRFYDRTNSGHSVGMNADVQGSRERANSKNYIDGTSWGATASMMAWVTPTSTANITYGVDVKHQHADWAINGNWDNSDSGTVDRSRGLSTFHILEFDSSIIQA